MRNIFLTCLFALGMQTAFAQHNMNSKYESKWKVVDAAFKKGLDQTAQAEIENILTLARAENNTEQIIKAICLYRVSLHDRDEKARINDIILFEKEMQGAKFPRKNLLHSMLGELYWTYYQENRWRILDRTDIDDNEEKNITDTSGIDTWSANDFYQKTAYHYQASLADKERLKAFPVNNMAEILAPGKNTEKLRPSLFDFLIQRSISYFAMEENEITQPAYAFTIADESAFSSASNFINSSFKTADTTSQKYRVLKLYQQTLSTHLADNEPAALIDADIARIRYVYRFSTLSNKKQLYRDALRKIAENYPHNEQAALANYYIAETYTGSFNPTQVADKSAVKELNLPEAKNICKTILEKFPKTEAAYKATLLIQQIETQSLTLETEAIVLPNNASLAKIQYRNIPTLYCKIIKITPRELRDLSVSYREKYADINSRPTIKNWQIALPDPHDYLPHSTEIKIESLPIGAYAFVVSNNAQFNDKESTQFALLSVSELSYITETNSDKSGTKVYVINRENGQPIANVAVKTWNYRYNYTSRKSEYQEGKSYVSDQDGSFVIQKTEATENSYSLQLTKGADDLFVQSSVYAAEQAPMQKDEVLTVMFTDRSIYRPGQTIYFKGIMMNKKNDGSNKHALLQNRKTTITLKDANFEVVKSIELITNDYGSFTGTFVAPEGLLTGTFFLEAEGGSTDFNIEEYKRPKFEVTFDTLKDTYKLFDKVSIRGLAKAYAGNNIDGAKVKYRVVREARFPYYWSFYRWGQPASAEMEITNGQLETKSDGSFEIVFSAVPDESIDRNTMPVFDYKIYADVTDLNGETRSGMSTVSVSYQSLILRIDIPAKADFNDFNALHVHSTNLAGTYIATPLTLTCKKLRSPAKTYRERLWTKCEINSMDETAFRKNFPLDEYNDENNYLNWKEEKTCWTKTINSTPNGLQYLQKIVNDDGWYVIEATALDKDGEKVTDKKYIRLFTGNKPVAQPGEHLLLINNNAGSEPGESVQVSISVPHENIKLRYSIERHNLSTEKWFELASLHAEVFKIAEADRGGFTIAACYVKDNRFYQGSEFINIPWSNKILDITLETFRDKILPGSEQEWKLKISGSKKEKVAAELIATLYDASLDAFRPHAFNDLHLFNNHYRKSIWSESTNFIAQHGRTISYKSYKVLTPYEKRYAELNWWGLINNYSRFGMNKHYAAAREEGEISIAYAQPSIQGGIAMLDEAASGPSNTPPPFPNLRKESEKATFNWSAEDEKNPAKPIDIPLRSNFSETAFFFPQLHTDKDGNIIFTFKAPDALTRWNILAFAHSKDLQHGLLRTATLTQKDLMIVPNTPRFIREGDQMVYSAKVTNLTANNMNAVASLHLIDAITEKSIDAAFQNNDPDQQVQINKGESASVNWSITIPEGFTNPVKIITTVKTAEQSDGEQNVVPVLLNSMMVTETLPLPVRANSSKTFTLQNLLHAEQSNTLRHYQISLEYTGNPAWYAVQALPYLTEYPYECAEQTFNRYYANVLATHLANASPRIKEIFSTWQEKDTAALLSNLEKNQELKSALLQETPWVMEAKNERQQKKNIATLFNLNRMSRELERTVRALELMQTPNGGFTWFKGMPDDRFITQYIITGIGRLLHIGVTEAGSERRIVELVKKAIPYLDARIKEDYDLLIKNRIKLENKNIDYTQIQYLYMRSFFRDIPLTPGSAKAFEYYKKQCAQYWLNTNRFAQGMTALALQRYNDENTAQAILKSLREKAIRSEEMGMYWKEVQNSYWWYEAPVETQSILIEAFSEIGADRQEIDELKIWLLKNKQTQNWKTTKATADAVYALMLQGSDWLAIQPEATIHLGATTILSKEQSQEAGTEYIKVNIPAAEIVPAMGNIQVSVKSSGTGTTWGAVYWQYFENLDKIASAETPLSIKKQLFIERASDRGPVLTSINEKTPLQVGDKVKVRIELRVDRDMEYVHMKDMRAACFEPINVLSQYQYQGGLGYYEATKDAATNFFFNWLAKGTYVFEYPMFVNNKGEYSNGVCTIQCMYAPDFSSHSEGIRIQVK